MSISRVALLSAAPAVPADPARVQKSQDSLRIAIDNPFAVLSNGDLPADESSIFTRDVYDHLMYFDERAQKFAPGIDEAIKPGVREFDPPKCADIYAKAFDRIGEMAYHFPLSSIPTVYVHGKDVAIRDNPFSAGQTFVADYAWK